MSNFTRAEAAAKADHLLSGPDTTTFELTCVKFPSPLNVSEQDTVAAAFKTAVAASVADLVEADVTAKVLEVSAKTYRVTAYTVKTAQVAHTATTVNTTINNAFTSIPSVVSLSSLPALPSISSASQDVSASTTTVKSAFALPHNPLSAGQRTDFISAYSAAVAASVPASAGVVQASAVTTTLKVEGSWYYLVGVLNGKSTTIDPLTVNQKFVQNQKVIAATSLRPSTTCPTSSFSAPIPVTSTFETTVVLADQNPDLTSLKDALALVLSTETKVSPSLMTLTATREGTGKVILRASFDKEQKFNFDASKIQTMFLGMSAVTDANEKQPPTSFSTTVLYSVKSTDFQNQVATDLRKFDYSAQLAKLNRTKSEVTTCGAPIAQAIAGFGFNMDGTVFKDELNIFLLSFGFDTAGTKLLATQIFGNSSSIGTNETVPTAEVATFLVEHFRTLPQAQTTATMDNITTSLAKTYPRIAGMAKFMGIDPTGEMTSKQSISFMKLVGYDAVEATKMLESMIIEAAVNGLASNPFLSSFVIGYISRLMAGMPWAEREGMLATAETEIAAKAKAGFNINSFDNPEAVVKPNSMALLIAVLATFGVGLFLMPLAHWVDKKKAIEMASGVRISSSYWREHLYASVLQRDPESLFSSKDRLLCIVVYVCVAVAMACIRYSYKLGYAHLAYLSLVGLLPAKAMETVFRRAAFGIFHVHIPFPDKEKKLESRNSISVCNPSGDPLAFDTDDPLPPPPMPPTRPPLPPTAPPKPTADSAIKAPPPPTTAPSGAAVVRKNAEQGSLLPLHSYLGKPVDSALPPAPPVPTVSFSSKPAPLPPPSIPPPATDPPAVQSRGSMPAAPAAPFSGKAPEVPTKRQEVLPPVPPKTEPPAGGNKLDQLQGQMVLMQHKMNTMQQEETEKIEKERQMERLASMRAQKKTQKLSSLPNLDSSMDTPLLTIGPKQTMAQDGDLMIMTKLPAKPVNIEPLKLSMPSLPPPPERLPPPINFDFAKPALPAPDYEFDSVMAGTPRAVTPLTGAWENEHEKGYSYTDGSMSAKPRYAMYVLAVLLVIGAVVAVFTNEAAKSASAVDVLLDWTVVFLASVMVWEMLAFQALEFRNRRLSKMKQSPTVPEMAEVEVSLSRTGSLMKTSRN